MTKYETLVAAAALLVLWPVAMLLAATDGQAGEVITGPAHVVDGDTIWIGQREIRFSGIDALEGGQPCLDRKTGADLHCGELATRELRSVIAGRDVTCTASGTDRHGRTVAGCELAPSLDMPHIDLQDWMVRSGWALDYYRYSHGRYAAAEAEARTAGLGIHTTRFVPPELWRRQKREHKGDVK
jgi:endonuclease YncB( thermonuclease family)